MTEDAAFALTTAIEVPVALAVALVLGVLAPPAGLSGLESAPDSAERAKVYGAVRYELRRRFWKLLMTATVMSWLTHPYLWAGVLWWCYRGWDYTTGVILMEILVMIAEAAMLRICVPLTWSHAMIISVAANGASWGTGWLILAWKMASAAATSS